MSRHRVQSLEANDGPLIGIESNGVYVNGDTKHGRNGAVDVPSTVPGSGDLPSRPADASSAPSIDEQIAKVMALTMQSPREGDRGHVVPCKWLERVMARGSDKPAGRSYSKDAAEGDIGPVDNSELIPESEKAFMLLR